MVSSNSVHVVSSNSNDNHCVSVSNCNSVKSSQPSHLRCTFFNARSLKNKLPLLHVLLYSGTFDVIAIAETWLNDSVSSAL